MSTKALERHLKPILPFLKTEGVTEICINKPQEIYVEKNRKFECYAVEELELNFLETLAGLVAEYNNQEFPIPLLSGSLPSGERVQFVMNPACESGKIICSIRRHQMREMSLEDYEAMEAFHEISAVRFRPNAQIIADLKACYINKDIMNFLKLAIKSKQNILISGGTGTGKTTFLNACLKIIPVTERLITVEDTREVITHQPNSANLLFNEEDAQITAQKLFKTCLRLRPDRIFLSELRGAEAWSFLRAANSGHPGSLSTIHADTPQGCFDQLVFMMQQAGSTSHEQSLRTYIQSIINIVIQLKRCTSEKRFMYISEIYFDAVHK